MGFTGLHGLKATRARLGNSLDFVSTLSSAVDLHNVRAGGQGAYNFNNFFSRFCFTRPTDDKTRRR